MDVDRRIGEYLVRLAEHGKWLVFRGLDCQGEHHTRRAAIHEAKRLSRRDWLLLQQRQQQQGIEQ